MELGFDSGWLVSSLAPAHGVYLGASKVLNDQGRKEHPQIVFIEDDLKRDIPLQEEFDYIILNNIIGSVADVQPFFGRLHRIASDRSRVAVTYYNYLWEPLVKLGESLGIKQKQPIQNWLSREDIALLLELAGFEVIKKGQRLLFPFYVPGLSWFFNSVLAKLPFIDRLCFWNYVLARPRLQHVPSGDFSASVIVPSRNEKGNIEGIVRRLPVMGKWTEVIFVENGSTDGTYDEIKRVAAEYKGGLRIRHISRQTDGKGAAVRAGFAMAEGDILMILDADMTVPPEDLPRFYEALSSRQSEYVHGSRLVYPMAPGAMRLVNLFGNKVFSMIFTWLLKQRIKDTLCGTKAMLRLDYQKLDANRSYFGEFDRWGDFDLIFGSHRLGLKMIEIPVHYKERIYGTSNMRAFKHGLVMLKMCFFAWRKLE